MCISDWSSDVCSSDLEGELSVIDGQRIVLKPTADGLSNAVTQAMDSATEVVRKRIDELGTREPTIIRQGDTRIVVQVPGLQDPDQLKALLGQTAKPEFKLEIGRASCRERVGQYV